MVNVSVQSEDIVIPAPEIIIRNSNYPIITGPPIIQTVTTIGPCISNNPTYLLRADTGKATKSVGSQMALQDLLDEIDVNLVLESAARRCNAEKFLMHYKVFTLF